MSNSTPESLRRPIGWWLKEADARITAAFDAELAGTGTDRRTWQLLSSLAAHPQRVESLVATLVAFDPPDVVQNLLEKLRRASALTLSDGEASLTPAGQSHFAEVAERVDRVRQRVSAALPATDYRQLIELLARLVDAVAVRGE